MGKSHCFVPGCKTGYPSDRKSCKIEGRKCGSLFLPPRDQQLFEKWKRVIPRKDKELTREDGICELHFSEDDIERHFVTKLPAGIIDKIPRGRVSLREGAFPIKFPNLPSYFTKAAVRYKEQVSVSKRVKEEKSSNEKMSVPGTNFKDSCQFENHTLTPNQCFSFNNLLKVINFIKAPSEWWSITHIKNFIVCQKWNNSFAVEKKVVVKNNLNVIAFIKDRQINLSDLEKVSGVKDISVVLQRMDEIVECAGTENRFSAIEPHSSQRIMVLKRLNSSLDSDHFTKDQFDQSSCLKVQLQKNTVPTVVKGFKNYLQMKPALKSREVNYSKTVKKTEDPTDVPQETSKDTTFISGTITISEDQIPNNRTICNEVSKCQLFNSKESINNENCSDSEAEIHEKLPDDTFYLSNSSCTSSNAKELVKRKLENVTAHYEKAQKKMKLYQQKCDLHARQITVLKEVMSNLQQINSISNEM